MTKRFYGYAFGLSAESDRSPGRWSHGDDRARGTDSAGHEELRRLAHYHMGRQRLNHTLQTTALVNEVYLRLADQTNPRWQNRAHPSLWCPGDAPDPG